MPSLKFSKVSVAISPKKNVRELTDWIIMTLWKLANGSLIKATKRKKKALRSSQSKRLLCCVNLKSQAISMKKHSKLQMKSLLKMGLYFIFLTLINPFGPWILKRSHVTLNQARRFSAKKLLMRKRSYKRSKTHNSSLKMKVNSNSQEILNTTWFTILTINFSTHLLGLQMDITSLVPYWYRRM